MAVASRLKKRTTRTCALALISALFALALLLPPRAAAQNTFKASVDVTLLDVSVLDRNRQPVTGLSPSDFTVLVDGKPRPIVSFKAVELPPPPPAPSTRWLRDVAPDVVTNTAPTGRVLVILIDDAAQEEYGDLLAIQKTRAIARAAVDDLGPDDMAAVVFTNNNHTAQDFTRDKAKLRAAIDTAALFPCFLSGGGCEGAAISGDIYRRADCNCGLCEFEAIERVSNVLKSLPGQRKVILDVSVGAFFVAPALTNRVQDISGGGHPVLDGVEFDCLLKKQESLDAAFRAAQLANVTIQAVDPMGLVVGQIAGGTMGDDASTAAFRNPTTVRTESLRTLAETTGGRAVVNDNDMELQVPALLAESRSYYLLAVDTGAADDDSGFHPIKVRVNRPGVDVRSRAGFYTPTAKERLASAERVSGVRGAMDTPFGNADIALDAFATPIATPDGKTVVAVALGVRRPSEKDETIGPERLNVVASAFNLESGAGMGEETKTLNVTWPPPSAFDPDDDRIDVLSRLPLAPGRYELRLGVERDGRAGAVHTYVDVPDFSKAALSLTGIIVIADTRLVAPRDAFADLLPGPPSTRRAFAPFERVQALARVHQGGAASVAPVMLTAHLIDEKNIDRVVDEKTLTADTFGASRTSDYEIVLPLDDLDTGQYLLRITAAMGTITTERTTRFTVKP